MLTAIRGGYSIRKKLYYRVVAGAKVFGKYSSTARCPNVTWKQPCEECNPNKILDQKHRATCHHAGPPPGIVPAVHILDYDAPVTYDVAEEQAAEPWFDQGAWVFVLPPPPPPPPWLPPSVLDLDPAAVHWHEPALHAVGWSAWGSTVSNCDHLRELPAPEPELPFALPLGRLQYVTYFRHLGHAIGLDSHAGSPTPSTASTVELTPCELEQGVRARTRPG